MLSQLPNDSDFDLGTLVQSDTELNNLLLQSVIDSLQSAQDSISAHDGLLSGSVDQLFFVPLDQEWVADTGAMLAADRGLDTALSNGSVTNIIDLLQLEFPMLDAAFQEVGDDLLSAPVIDAAGLF